MSESANHGEHTARLIKFLFVVLAPFKFSEKMASILIEQITDAYYTGYNHAVSHFADIRRERDDWRERYTQLSEEYEVLNNANRVKYNEIADLKAKLLSLTLTQEQVDTFKNFWIDLNDDGARNPKIQLIKKVREDLQTGLKEAKDLSEKWIDNGFTL